MINCALSAANGATLNETLRHVRPRKIRNAWNIFALRGATRAYVENMCREPFLNKVRSWQTRTFFSFPSGYVAVGKKAPLKKE